MMKKLFTLFIAITLFNNAKAQWVTIPDVAFVTWLTNNYPSAMNGNQLDTTNSGVLTAIGMNCSNTTIVDLTGIQYFKNLQNFSCSNTNISNTALLNLPKKVEKLDISNNYLLSTMPILPKSVYNLNCSYCGLHDVSNFQFCELQTINCSHNNITIFPTLPSGYSSYNIGYPMSTHLDFSFNNISIMPSLPTFGCIMLDIQHNNLHTLPDLTNVCLILLNCNNNPLVKLPEIKQNNYMTELDVKGTLISYIPEIPQSLTTLYTVNCPNLSCLPDLKNLPSSNWWNIVNGSQITCLSTYGWNNQFANYLPLCKLFNPHGCTTYYNISGEVYIDKDTSCTYNATDFALNNIKVELWRNGNMEQQTFTRYDGSYTFDAMPYDTFEIKIDTTNLPFYLSCPTQQVLTSIITPTDSVDFNMNFAMQCKGMQNDYRANSLITDRHRPGRFTNITISAGLDRKYNYICTSSNLSGKIKLYKSGPLKLSNSYGFSHAPNIITDDSLIWNISNFSNLINISFHVKVDTNATIGSVVIYNLVVEPTFPDINKSNNSLAIVCPIRNGYDPNEKSGKLNINDSTILYTIQFQNTGNDTAQHIIVRDTLSNDLQISSMDIVDYSHQPFTQTFGNVAVFNFPNINLVDSATNEQGSHGFVSFRIKVKPSGVGTIIQNKAAIYFDFNPPIYTNTCLTSICYQPTFFNFTKTVCPLVSFLFNGKKIYSSGIYLDTLTNQHGCDSLVTLDLKFDYQRINISQSICQGNSYFFDGKNISTAGIYHDTLQSYLGCDSFITLHLNVNQPTSKTINQTICSNQFYNFNNRNLNQTGIYYDTLQNYLGCDSFITLNLNVKQISTYSLNQNICIGSSYYFNGKNLTTIGTYFDTLQNYVGCDSIITLNLNVKSISNFSFAQTICSNQFYSFNNHQLNSTGIYYDTLQNYVGCDSFITLHLIVNPISNYSFTKNICIGSSFNFNGNNLITAGIYYDTLQNYLGCDSFITLHLNVNQPSSKTINQIICNNQPYNLNGTILNQSGTYYDTIQNHSGCDSFITLHLVVKPISSYSFNKTICSNDFYSFNHLLLNSTGIYFDTIINHNGCDSFITLHLTVLPASSSTFNKTICSNNPFLFNGHLLTQSGKYYDTLLNYVGCDSIITLHLIAKPSYLYNSTTLTVCEGSAYFYNGHVYTTNTQLYDTFISQLGCDSIVGIKIIAIPAPDTSVVQSGNTLIAQAQHSSFYWYDCTQHQLIQNANDDTFMVHHSGSYAVLVKDSITLCSDTSNCRTIVVSGVEEVKNSRFSIYPNPTSSNLVIGNLKLDIGYLTITDVLGRVLKQITNLKYPITNIQVEDLPSGIYFIKATDTKGNTMNAKFIKE